MLKSLSLEFDHLHLYEMDVGIFGRLGGGNCHPSKIPIMKKKTGQYAKETEVAGKKEQRRAVNNAHLFRINIF